MHLFVCFSQVESQADPAMLRISIACHMRTEVVRSEEEKTRRREEEEERRGEKEIPRSHCLAFLLCFFSFFVRLNPIPTELNTETETVSQNFANYFLTFVGTHSIKYIRMESGYRRSMQCKCALLLVLHKP